MTAGVLTLASGQTLSVTGPASFGVPGANGPSINGPGTLSTSGTTTLPMQTGAAVDLFLGSASRNVVGPTWDNTGLVNLGGAIDIGPNDISETATIINATGAVFDLTTDTAGIVPHFANEGNTSTFINAGLLEKTGGTATSSITSAVTNTATIAVDSGTLAFSGGGTFAGSITGTGVVAFAGGTSTLSATVAPSVLFDGGSVALATASLGVVTETAGAVSVTEDSTISDSFTMTAGVLTLASGQTLSVTGPASFGVPGANGPSINGPGTLSTSGTTTLPMQTGAAVDLFLGSASRNVVGPTWDNTGLVNLGGAIDIGPNDISETATIINATGAVFDLTTDTAGIVPHFANEGNTSTFINAGLLEKTGGTATSSITSAVTNTATIAVDSGTLAFSGGGTFAGSITGTGVVAFAGGTSTLSATVAPSVLFDGGSVALATASLGVVTETAGAVSVTEDSTISDSFTMTAGVLTLASGQTLSVTGPASFGVPGANGPSINGPGTLSTSGTTTLPMQTGAAVDLFLGSASRNVVGPTWDNTGLVNLGGAIDIGPNDISETATIINATGAVFDLTTDTAGIVPHFANEGNTSTFINAGLLEKTGGTATSSITSAVTNTATIAVDSGTLAFSGGGTFAGSITGTGVVAFAGGTSTLSATVAPSVLFDGGSVALATASLGVVTETAGAVSVTEESTISDSFTMTAGVLTLASGQTLSVTGPASFGVPGANGPSINGPGTLSTSGTTTLPMQTGAAVDLFLGSASRNVVGPTWDNTGLVNLGGAIDIGPNDISETATIINATGAVFDLTTDTAGIVPHFANEGNTSTFINAGLSEKTGGTATSSITSAVTNTATIAVDSGTLDMTNSVTGAGLLELADGGVLRLDAALDPDQQIAFSTGTPRDVDPRHAGQRPP